MLKEYKAKTVGGLGLGILAIFIGYLMSLVDIGTVLWFAAIFIWGGVLLFVWGLWCYAKGKGYHGIWGLLGFLGPIGLIVLIFFPDKQKAGSKGN